MSFAEEMLEASPAGVELGAAAIAAAVDACADTAQACTSCADSCLAEDDVAALRRCIALCQNCADICVATARTLCRQLAFDRAVARQLLETCVRECGSCAEECEKHAAHHAHCAICAKACLACVQACSELRDADRARSALSRVSVQRQLEDLRFARSAGDHVAARVLHEHDGSHAGAAKPRHFIPIAVIYSQCVAQQCTCSRRYILHLLHEQLPQPVVTGVRRFSLRGDAHDNDVRLDEPVNGE